MNPNLIVMLTYNDQTVSNAKETYLECADLPVPLWGFKDIGLSKDQMADLVETMKKDGKKTFLEIVSLSESECMAGAEIAVECGFDYLLGTLYFQSVHEYLKANRKAFYPFCGDVHGHPSILGGTIDEIVSDAKKLEALGVQGIDLLSYRHREAPEELSARIVKELNIPIIIAGSIDSYEKIDKMKEINPYGFTIGTALFDCKFSDSNFFRSQLENVMSYLKK